MRVHDAIVVRDTAIDGKLFWTGPTGTYHWTPEYPDAYVMPWREACDVAAKGAIGTYAVRNYGTDHETIFTPMEPERDGR